LIIQYLANDVKLLEDSYSQSETDEIFESYKLSQELNAELPVNTHNNKEKKVKL
jgi:hypothetical protein